MFIESFKVESPNVKYSEDEIHSVYDYDTTELVHEEKNGAYQWVVRPKTVKYEFKTQTNVPKLGFVFISTLFNVFISCTSMPVLFKFRLLIVNCYCVCFIYRVMLVGWGGNNGSTLTAGVIANRE